MRAASIIRDMAAGFNAIRARSQGEAFHPSLYEALAEVGREFAPEPFTPEQAESIKAMRKVIRPKKQQCFSNSQRAVSLARFEGRWTYCEGYVVGHDIGFPIHHGWLMLDGKLVDLTLDASKFSYFGIAVPRKIVFAVNLETSFYQPVLDDWMLGFKYQAKALEAARKGNLK